jgi:hypothetical protein
MAKTAKTGQKVWAHPDDTVYHTKHDSGFERMGYVEITMAEAQRRKLSRCDCDGSARQGGLCKS